MEGPDEGHNQPTTGFVRQGEENTSELRKKRHKVPQEEKDKKKNLCGSVKRDLKKSGKMEELLDLSKKDLVHLLGVMEGEVQVTSSHVHQTSQTSSYSKEDQHTRLELKTLLLVKMGRRLVVNI